MNLGNKCGVLLPWEGHGRIRKEKRIKDEKEKDNIDTKNSRWKLGIACQLSKDARYIYSSGGNEGLVSNEFSENRLDFSYYTRCM